MTYGIVGGIKTTIWKTNYGLFYDIALLEQKNENVFLNLLTIF